MRSFLVVFLLLLAGTAGCGTGFALRHRVAAGESVADIARRYGVPEYELRGFNRLAASDRVQPGDIIFVPGGVATATPPASSGAMAAGGEAPPRSSTAVKALSPPALGSARQTTEPVVPRPVVPNSTDLERRFAWPVNGPILRGFGTGPAGDSRGVDVEVAPGTAVHAAARGRVTYSGVPAPAYGPIVILQHDDGYHTVYASLLEATVTRGEAVSRGQLLGKGGVEKGGLPAHFHFEVRKDERPVDPLLVLPPR